MLHSRPITTKSNRLPRMLKSPRLRLPTPSACSRSTLLLARPLPPAKVVLSNSRTGTTIWRANTRSTRSSTQTSQQRSLSTPSWGTSSTPLTSATGASTWTSIYAHRPFVGYLPSLQCLVLANSVHRRDGVGDRMDGRVGAFVGGGCFLCYRWIVVEEKLMRALLSWWRPTQYLLKSVAQRPHLPRCIQIDR